MITRLFCPSACSASVVDISLDELQAKGVKYLILDLDNTLAHWQRLEISEPVKAWVADALARGMKLCIASNTRNRKRLNDISGRLGIQSFDRALKPRRKGFLRAMEMMSAQPEQTIVIGDQLLTDIFGGNRAGLYTILVAPMHPREFIGTKLSRLIERPLLFWFRRRGLLGTKGASSQSQSKERA